VTQSPPYAELDARSNFSFLEGASHPAELVAEAKALGLAALGLADRNSLAGVVRAHVAAKAQGLRLLIGARLVFQDGATLIVYPRDRAAYGRLCRLLSLGKSGIDGELSDDPSDGVDADRIEKGACRLEFAQAMSLGDGLVALAPAPASIDAAFQARLTAWRRLWPDELYLAAAPLYRGDDRARLAQLAAIAKTAGVAMAATNAVLYHHPDRRRLQDVLTCIREKTLIDEAGYRLQANAERGLKSPAEMARLFRGHEDALARTGEIAKACRFSLDELAYVYPDEPVPPGRTPDQHLRRLCIEGARRAFPRGVAPGVVKTLRKELRLIRKLRYAPYFLTVHDIVEWARAPERAILCQGRGSAANSVVCFCLGVTAVNPAEQDVLFERFISEARSEPPDIDVDFEHERRERVIQYIYQRYGRHRAAICATVIHYRPRSAIRDVCKALGLTEDVASALANTVWGSFGSRLEDAHVDGVGVAREDPRLALALELTQELIGFPRHLSQHVGGFVLTQGPLIETVPVGNAAMAQRTFIEWDKDDIDALKIMKVDVLALGMLTAIRRSFEMISETYGPRLTLASVPRERARVYDMLCRADSLGVFQVESRAQMNMLPRLRPREFYDLVVQVAIVRPGPIQGDMVHPYLKRRTERREAQARGRPFEIAYPSPAPEHGPDDELKRVLQKTLGVPLFQEQAMRIAMEAACFTGDEANGLRRAMATFRHVGTIGTYEAMMVGRMIARGYPPDFARNCFNQIKGFGEYGFPESHAASFAQLVYVSSWLKCVFPEVFAAALLNSQPMGFYAPAQIVRDARAHDVTVRPPDVNASDWDCTLETLPRRRRRAVRLGFNRIDGFREAWALSIASARARGGAFVSLDDLRSRAALPHPAIDALAAADALSSLNLDRRAGLWRAKGLTRGASPAPLFAAMGLEEGEGAEVDQAGRAALPPMGLSQDVVADYETLRLSLKAHPMSFLRTHFAALGARPASAVAKTLDGRRTATAGIVLVRQRPGTAKGVVFLTLEDETGTANIVIWPKVFEQFRPIVMGARLILVRGRVQHADDAPAGGVIHLVAETLEDRTQDLDLLSAPDASKRPSESGASTPRLDPPYAPGDEPGRPRRSDVGRSSRPARPHHPRNVRPIPRSRDFH
jgi:error-prone DNA polymerase